MSDRCPHVTGDTTMHCEAAERFAQIALAANDAHCRVANENDELRAEVERLRDSLSVTGDTRHEAMEAAIRVAEAHSETIRQLRAEVERLRATVETLCVTCSQLADQQAMPDNFWVQSVTAAGAALRGESVTTTPTPEQPTQSPEPTSSE